MLFVECEDDDGGEEQGGRIYYICWSVGSAHPRSPSFLKIKGAEQPDGPPWTSLCQALSFNHDEAVDANELDANITQLGCKGC